MTTFIQISVVGYDHIEDAEELAALEAYEGTYDARNFVEILDGDESLIRRTGIKYEVAEPSELIDWILDGQHDEITEVVIDPDLDGISDYLEEAGFELVASYWSSHQTYRKA